MDVFLMKKKFQTTRHRDDGPRENIYYKIHSRYQSVRKKLYVTSMAVTYLGFRNWEGGDQKNKINTQQLTIIIYFILIAIA